MARLPAASAAWAGCHCRYVRGILGRLQWCQVSLIAFAAEPVVFVAVKTMWVRPQYPETAIRNITREGSGLWTEAHDRLTWVNTLRSINTDDPDAVSLSAAYHSWR